MCPYSVCASRDKLWTTGLSVCITNLILDCFIFRQWQDKKNGSFLGCRGHYYPQLVRT